MRIETLEVAGIAPALHAMRNPFDSWEKSATQKGTVCPADRELSESLAKAGPPHSKHLRMIQVWAEIRAPRYWWQEFDTNRIGVEKVSCSTMHTLTRRPLTRADFEWDGDDGDLQQIIEKLNTCILAYSEAGGLEKEKAFRMLKQCLPESFIQRRTVMMSYQALRSIYEQRKNHRLREWRKFCDWIKTLPESWMITGESDDGQAGV